MIPQIKRLYRAISAWTSHTLDPQLIDMLTANLGPVERHVAYSIVLNRKGLFHPRYHGWRITRCRKILELYGIEYFEGKKILELGAGHADIGAFFAALGADVLSLEGRAQNVNFARLKHRQVAGIRIEQFDLNEDFSMFGTFDLIINFGLLYHLANVDDHLKRCFAMANEMVLETVVCDSTDPHKLVLLSSDTNEDQLSVAGTGSRPSPFYVERIARENNMEYVRCFASDLNYTDQFRYDWPHKDDNRLSEDYVLRRFWRLKRKAPL
jgi:SAM-dependent methyltransferase